MTYDVLQPCDLGVIKVTVDNISKESILKYLFLLGGAHCLILSGVIKGYRFCCKWGMRCGAEKKSIREIHKEKL